MLEKILALDTQLFVYLNGLGSETYDGLWLLITKQFNWIPFFLVILFFILKKIGFKINFYLVLFFAPIIVILFYIINEKINPESKNAIVRDIPFSKKIYHLFALLLCIALLILFTDQITNFFKFNFERLRPCNNEDIKGIIRLVKTSNTYSFFSGHAANSMATMTFLFFFLKKQFRFSVLLFIFPLIFAYSRIYLGLHYPLDILCGYLCGFTLGFVMYKVYLKVQQRYFPL